ncbi:hypothetical protein RA29_16775 [Tateyamaria sp. ANG-S1]|nr:hypothetical protein RA29_16775 [Tateyamaria sp. ANG-S1]
MTDQEKIVRLECLLADYVYRYGALPETSRYFVDVSQESDGEFEPSEQVISRSPLVADELHEKHPMINSVFSIVP